MTEVQTGFSIFTDIGGMYTSNILGRPQTLEGMIEFVANKRSHRPAWWSDELIQGYGGTKSIDTLLKETKKKNQAIVLVNGKYVPQGYHPVPVAAAENTEQFRIGGIYRQQDGVLVKLTALHSELGRTAHGLVLSGASIGTTTSPRRLSDGKTCFALSLEKYDRHLVPGEVDVAGNPLGAAPAKPLPHEEIATAMGTFLGNKISMSTKCTCGFAFGQHTGILCPGKNRTFAEATLSPKKEYKTGDLIGNHETVMLQVEGQKMTSSHPADVKMMHSDRLRKPWVKKETETKLESKIKPAMAGLGRVTGTGVHSHQIDPKYGSAAL